TGCGLTYNPLRGSSDRVDGTFQTDARAKPVCPDDGAASGAVAKPVAPDADRQAREYIDRVVESHRRNGYGLKLSKKRYEEAVGRAAETFRGLIEASRGRRA